MKDFYFVTANPGKLKDAKQVFGENIKHIDIDLDEIQEMDTDKIAEHKAKQAWMLKKKPLVIWDTAVYIHCLNGFPGPLIKWFWEIVTLEKICRIAKLFDDYKISLKVTLTYYDGKMLKHFYSSTEGTLPSKPRGTNGYGWDSIFIQKGLNQTNAELNNNDPRIHATNMTALQNLKKYLNE